MADHPLLPRGHATQLIGESSLTLQLHYDHPLYERQ
jgi:hypothetical protein